MTAENPLLTAWTTPFGMPPFAAIRPEHYRPAFETAIAEHQREIAAIADNPEPPTFANTIEAMERAGRLLDRVASVFFNLTGAHTSDDLEAIELEVAPLLSRHRSAIYLNEKLFLRIDAIVEAAPKDLDAEQARVLERYHTGFRRSGAGLPAEVKKRLAAISERLATLGTNFGQNVLADEKGWSLVLEGEDDLAGLPDFLVASAAQAARDRGLAEGKHVITLSRSSIEPFLQFSARRDLREKAFLAWTARGEAGKTDNRGIIAETIALRSEQATLLGYESFAHFRLDDSMAKTPEAAMGLLTSVWEPARSRAIEERDALQALVREEGGNFELAAWDWRYYSERRRKAEFDLDEALLKPYLQLDKVIEAAFDTASRLFGLRFTERTDIPAYHPDVRVFEVTDESGAPVGLFLGDYFARSSKRSGAWMSDYRGQEKLVADIRPIIVNVMNFAKGADGAPTLLSYDDARTLFHEFGHGLHGLLSDVTYPSIAGTNVARDFVEFPSQLYEHWFERPEILSRFAVHYRTGEPMPDALIGRLKASRSFNQGFATVEYVASALVDMKLHLLKEAKSLDATAFEKAVLDEIGMPQAMVMRHRTPHFQHVFAGDGYSSAYYSYLWSETLDADGFRAFEEAGDIFAPEPARKLKDFVYAAGNRRTPDEAYRAFRGRDPDPSALLEKRGLMDTAV
ncbi:M3 family metallopeptidase [Kaistia geumhonensis]|uniref:Peptidyl-dipeptidase Dcp n=1 Tax=Kaistia geumhonensis TaxID=410839 RepID=A0ABU0M683_9HYPH|nr:M3 family metallopeptidase [Kaistia geumhonensis]MCX5478309.1 M3 family metallopeptidase [Kaistia geumhonensis]MDQ0516474.1 peptidyl-dipeptidase Dcp [Kaistia geumhonensis]